MAGAPGGGQFVVLKEGLGKFPDRVVLRPIVGHLLQGAADLVLGAGVEPGLGQHREERLPQGRLLQPLR